MSHTLHAYLNLPSSQRSVSLPGPAAPSTAPIPTALQPAIRNGRLAAAHSEPDAAQVQAVCAAG